MSEQIFTAERHHRWDECLIELIFFGEGERSPFRRYIDVRWRNINDIPDMYLLRLWGEAFKAISMIHGSWLLAWRCAFVAFLIRSAQQARARASIKAAFCLSFSRLARPPFAVINSKRSRWLANWIYKLLMMCCCCTLLRLALTPVARRVETIVGWS